MKSWSSRAGLGQSRSRESLPRVGFPEGFSNMTILFHKYVVQNRWMGTPYRGTGILLHRKLKTGYMV